MKTQFGFIVSILLTAALSMVGVPAWGKNLRKDKKSTDGYLERTLPSVLSFAVDPLPAARMMLVTKAPKAPISLPPASPVALDLNKTAPPAVVETIDPPISPTPTLSVPSSITVMPSVSPLRPGAPVIVPPVVVTTDDVLELLELDSTPSSKIKPSIIVPFELPFSQTPSAAVLNSKARYIKRWK